MRSEIAVLDYGSGNVRSVMQALKRAGVDQPRLTDSAPEALAAKGLIVPGVGAYGAVMEKLRGGGWDRIIFQRHKAGAATLGICVGLQVLFEAGNEHGQVCEGLGLLPGKIEQLQADVVPHMGWSPVSVPAGSKLFRGIETERFYFLHSYKADPAALAATDAKVTTAFHGEEFVAAIEAGALAATQFHPEKSGHAGVALLRNWIETLPS